MPAHKLWHLIWKPKPLKDTPSPNLQTDMTLKNLEDKDSKAFWAYVEKSKEEWRTHQPSWSRQLEQRQTQHDDTAASQQEEPVLHS